LPKGNVGSPFTAWARRNVHGANALRLATLGELPAGVSLASLDQVRDLTDRGALPREALTVLTALWPATGSPEGTGLEYQFEPAAQVLTALAAA
jgi:hypothetical protein